jgi:2,5-furandicarboxylate decarboxylase 1
MPFNDFREFLDELERTGELVRLKRPVNAKYELGAYSRRMLDQRGPAIQFENVIGYDMPVTCEVLATRRRFAAALETTEADLAHAWLARADNRIAPVVEAGPAPCQEVVISGDDVDLTALPIPTWNEFDGGPYISMGLVFSKDPVDESRNVAIYRIQVHDKKSIGMLFAPYRHLALHAKGSKAKRFPIAIAIGVDPVCAIAAAVPLPYGEDEMALAGALRGAPVQLTPCVSVPLEVPSTAEIVLEGELDLEQTEIEGPYGDFTGYYNEAAPRPVIHIKTVTMRRNAIFHGSYQGIPPQDSYLMNSIPVECELLRSVAPSGIRDITLTEGGCGVFTAVASVEKRCEGHGRMVAAAIFGTWAGRGIKHLTIVPASVDVRNHVEVERAVALNVQPHRDIDILHNMAGFALDSSLPPEERLTRFARTSKILIDATGFKYEGETPALLCMPPADVLATVDEHWEEDFGTITPT